MTRSSVTICSLALIIIGIILIFAGGFITYIYFTEITPPNYDAYYKRYAGSNFPRIVGILILMAGLTLFWASSIYLVYAYYRGSARPHQSRYYFESALPVTSSPVVAQTAIKENYIS